MLASIILRAKIFISQFLSRAQERHPLPLSALLIVNSTVHAATDKVTLDIYIFLVAFWPRKREMIRNRRARNTTTNNKQPEVLPGCFLESWVNDYPLTEKPEGSVPLSPDSHGGYWVSAVKMMPKLPGITHQITYYIYI